MKIRPGKNNMTAIDIAHACGGKTVAWGGAENTLVSAVCTDSREVSDASLFVAIRGERVDGHDFIANALNVGAVVLCEKFSEEFRCKFDQGCAIIVDDTVDALGHLAKEYKKEFNAKTVAITGSVGKTTTKEFVASVIGSELKISKTAGNHNSLIGMPLSMLETPSQVDAVVLEMGMNHIGEISKMSRVAEPDVAIITNIGTSHLEYLGTRENIARAKLEILDGMKKDGVLILNGDEPLLRDLTGLPQSTLYVSLRDENADFYVSNVKHTHTESHFDVSHRGMLYEDIKLPFVGDHGVTDAAFAFAAGVVLGISEQGIRRGIADFRGADMRQNIYDLGCVHIIEDCYNASPESMRAAISLLSEYADSANEKGRKIAVLGDMLELGEGAADMHTELGRYAFDAGMDLLFTFGPLSENIANGAVCAGMSKESVFSFADISDPISIGDNLIGCLKKNDTVLFKASRSVGVERIVKHVKNHG